MAYTLFVISIAFGIALSFLTARNITIGTFLLGMWLGVVLAMLLNNAVLYMISSENS